MKEKNDFKHVSVLLDETINGLNIKEDGIYVDGTLGGAGHSSVIVSKLSKGRLIGIDQDSDAIKSATERLKPWEDKVTIVSSNYENMVSVVRNLGREEVVGILRDLGVVSYQLDTPERGFSYR